MYLGFIISTVKKKKEKKKEWPFLMAVKTVGESVSRFRHLHGGGLDLLWE